MPADPNSLPSRLARLVRRLNTHRVPSGIDSATRRRAASAFQARRARESLFGEHAVLFGEPAWDILLDLFLAQAAGRTRTLDQLCGRIGISAGSARRWTETLIERQMLVRRAQGGDLRKAEMSLSSTGVRLVTACLKPARSPD